MAITSKQESLRIILLDNKNNSVYSTSRINQATSNNGLRTFGMGISGLMAGGASKLQKETIHVLEEE